MMARPWSNFCKPDGAQEWLMAEIFVNETRMALALQEWKIPRQ